jgi:hypothetical protein
VGEIRNTCIIFIEKPVGKRTLCRPRIGREDNIEVDFKGIYMKLMNSIELTYTVGL